MSTPETLLYDEAQRLGFELPPSAAETIHAFTQACLARLSHIEGGQDHAHAWNGVRSAIDAAREGNVEYVRAGLWEAAKVLDLHVWDRDVTRVEGRPSDSLA